MSVAQNAAIWQYSERIREVEEDERPMLLHCVDVRLFLECARGSEKEDFEPAFTFLDAKEYAAGTISSIAELLRTVCP